MKILKKNKLFISSMYFFVIILFLSCNDRKEKLLFQVKINEIDDLISHFKEPPSEFRSVPFWVWNDEVTKDKIEQQLNKIGGEEEALPLSSTRLPVFGPVMSIY